MISIHANTEPLSLPCLISLLSLSVCVCEMVHILVLFVHVCVCVCVCACACACACACVCVCCRCTDDFNGAQLKAVCVEAGMIALRRKAEELNHEDYMDGACVAFAVETLYKDTHELRTPL